MYSPQGNRPRCGDTARMKTSAWLLPCIGAPLHAGPAKLDYNRDVRPIVSDKCFKCHGPDSQARDG
jgi:hypothetical protein